MNGSKSFKAEDQTMMSVSESKLPGVNQACKQHEHGQVHKSSYSVWAMQNQNVTQILTTCAYTIAIFTFADVKHEKMLCLLNQLNIGTHHSNDTVAKMIDTFSDSILRSMRQSMLKLNPSETQTCSDKCCFTLPQVELQSWTFPCNEFPRLEARRDMKDTSCNKCFYTNYSELYLQNQRQTVHHHMMQEMSLAWRHLLILNVLPLGLQI